jgi:prepilin-type N-terminal cleavage/methylation domain-containing protein
VGSEVTSRQRGLTIVEVLLAVALIAILAGASVISSARAASAARARAAAEHVAALLQGAFDLAASENTQARVRFTRGSWPPTAEVLRGSYWVDVTSELSAVRNAAAPAGPVTVSSTTYPSDTYTVQRDPSAPVMVATEGEVIVASSHGMIARVVTTRLGRACVEVCR